MLYPEDELPFDEDNDSELYSADSFNGNFKDDNEEIEPFAVCVHKEYLKDPKWFAESRDSVYKFDDVHYCVYDKYDKWTLVDIEDNVTYKVFNDEKELAEFVKPDVITKAFKRIIMDRVVHFNPDYTFQFSFVSKVKIDTICLRKGCLKVSALPFYFWEDDENYEPYIVWYTENVTIAEEDKLCCELYKAGLHGKTIDERYEAASMPF